MLAFKHYHSIIEAKRYLLRFGLAIRIEYLEGIVHTKLNEYDAIIKPLKVWLATKGVKIETDCSVTDLDMDEACNTVSCIHARQSSGEVSIPVAESDLLFVTNGSMTQNSCFGDNKNGLVTCGRNPGPKPLRC